MADPMTNMEIEDVLSSIRRLVSEDLRPIPRTDSPAPAPVSGRLVLTPAFRVSDPEADSTDGGDALTAAEMAEPAASPDVAGFTMPGLAEDHAVLRFGRRPESDAGSVDSVKADGGAGLAYPVADHAKAGGPLRDEDFSDEALFAEDAADLAGLDGELADLGFDETDPGFDDDSDLAWLATEAALGAADDIASLEATISELEAAVAARDEEWEPDGSEAAASTLFSMPPSLADRVASAARPEPIATQEYAATSEYAATREPAAAPATAATVATAVASAPAATHEAAAAPANAAAPEPAAASVDAPVTAEAAHPVVPPYQPASAPQDRGDASAPTVDAPAPEASDRPAAEAPLRSGSPLRRLNLGAAVAPSDDVEAIWLDDAPASPQKFAESIGAAPDASIFVDTEETILDEDTLRELVIDTIRQELQGALGERITRNVRKLVRAEIQRAMSSREFE